ncbi:phosphorylase family protein, partial [Klebsiella pneumoniae]|uniref:phosphorylase family protein n=1 Tax=Klebsiella pneumoniae TaxID=573 RepID=UPI003F7B278E
SSSKLNCPKQRLVKSCVVNYAMSTSDCVSRIALIGAMQEELSAVLALIPDASCETVAGRQFWRGHLHGHAVVAVLSGIGKVAAAISATVLIE